MIKLSESLEDYLETIYILKENNGEVRITDIANSLSISKPSVNKAVKVLGDSGFVVHEKYGLIHLTNEGLKKAKEVLFKHKTLVNFLVEDLKIDPIIAQEDACKIEHVISEHSLKKIIEYKEKTKKN